MTIYVTARHMEGGNGHEHIASVRWSDGARSDTTSRARMVVFIRDEHGDVRVSSGGREVQVGVVNATPPYLRTHADGVWTDNLLALPTY